MGTAINRVDRVGERINRLGICISVLNSRIYSAAIHHLFNKHNRMNDLAVAVQVAHKGSDPALKIKRHLTVNALIQKADRYTMCDKCHLPEALH